MSDIVIVTADGQRLTAGDRAYNYYDMSPGRIGAINPRPQPDTAKGQTGDTPIEQWSAYWFRFIHDDGTGALLDGSRICSEDHARRRGWL